MKSQHITGTKTGPEWMAHRAPNHKRAMQMFQMQNKHTPPWVIMGLPKSSVGILIDDHLSVLEPLTLPGPWW